METEQTTGAGVEWEADDAVVRVRIDRPGKKNALTHAMYAALADALEHAERTPSIGCVVVTAGGDAFTAGNDLGDFAAGVPADGERPVTRFLDALATGTVPVVAAVNGIAVGVGVTMLLHCDLVYASSTARFQLPFVNLGLVPEAASSLLLPQLVGRRRAADLLYTGRWFDAGEARDLGIVNEVLPPEQLATRTEEAVQLLAAKSPQALRRTKELLRGDATLLRDRMAEEGRHFDAQLRSPDFAEAFAAFTERRPPDFRR